MVDTDVFSWIRWQRGRFREFDDLVERHILALSFATVAELRAGVLIGAGATSADASSRSG